MEYSFTAFGHKNLLATHKTTLEFTKDKEISLRGDCIVGVKSNFDLEQLKKFIKKCGNKKITIKIKANGKKFSEEFFAFINPLFEDESEIVLRKSNVATKRTFAIRSDKSADDLGRDFVDFLKNPEQKIEIVFIAE